METSHTKISLAMGTWLGLVALTMALSGSMLLVHFMGQKPASVQQQRGTIGDISKMSAEDIESAYGKVDQDKLKEVKDGIFRNIANRRRAACAPQPQQQCYWQAQSYYGTYYQPAPSYTPSYAVPSQVVPSPVYNPPNPLKIQPSCNDGSCQVPAKPTSTPAPQVKPPAPKIHPPVLKEDNSDMTYTSGQPWKFKPSI